MPHSSSLPPPPTTLLDGAALFLDFDGTLVPLTDIPEAVEVDAELHRLLHALRDRLDGRLAIVSGRSVATLRDLFGLGDFILSGTHGLEYAHPGKPVEGPERLAAIDLTEARMLDFVTDKPGLLVERKTLSVGLHFRRAPEWDEACRLLAEQLAAETGLAIQPGKMLYELRPAGAGKGEAVRHLMLSAPMAGGIPIFVGDDVTDEEGMKAARALGGHGILVGAPRATAAQYILEQVSAVRHYLEECVAALPLVATSSRRHDAQKRPGPVADR